MECYDIFNDEAQDQVFTFDPDNLEARYFASLDRLGEAVEASFAQSYRHIESWENYGNPAIVQALCWETDYLFDREMDEFLTDEEISRKDRPLIQPIGTKPRKVVPPQIVPPPPRVKKVKPLELQKPMEIGYWLGVPMTPKSILKKRNNRQRRHGRYNKRTNRFRKQERKALKVSFKEEIDFI